MQLKVFSIRDKKGEIFMQPFFQKTVGEAERSFKTLTQDEKSMISKYPDDFDLYHVGEYDDQNGMLLPLKEVRMIISATQLKGQ